MKNLLSLELFTGKRRSELENYKWNRLEKTVSNIALTPSVKLLQVDAFILGLVHLLECTAELFLAEVDSQNNH